MPLSIVLILRPIQAGVISYSHGAAAYAAALNLLRSNLELSTEIHAAGKQKPLRVGLIDESKIQPGQDIHFSTEKCVEWRICGLNEEVTNQFMKTEIGSIVQFDDALLRVENIFSNQDQHHDAITITYQELIQRNIDDHLSRSVTLEFITPTSFSAGRLDLPFPLPKYIFGSLLDSWNAFSPIKIGDWKPAFEEIIALSRWQGRSIKIQTTKWNAVGFFGRFTFVALDPISELCSVMSTLSDYAFFAGAGAHVTSGMGRIRRI